MLNRKKPSNIKLFTINCKHCKNVSTMIKVERRAYSYKLPLLSSRPNPCTTAHCLAAEAYSPPSLRLRFATRFLPLLLLKPQPPTNNYLNFFKTKNCIQSKNSWKTFQIQNACCPAHNPQGRVGAKSIVYFHQKKNKAEENGYFWEDEEAERNGGKL